jgi:hypothetical protein
MSDDRKPQDVAELMVAAASALEGLDFDRLDQLSRWCRDWLQPEREMSAQLAMLEAMMVACEELRHVDA